MFLKILVRFGISLKYIRTKFCYFLHKVSKNKKTLEIWLRLVLSYKQFIIIEKYNESVLRLKKVFESKQVCSIQNGGAIKLTSIHNVQFEDPVSERNSASRYHSQSWPHFHVELKDVAFFFLKKTVLSLTW